MNLKNSSYYSYWYGAGIEPSTAPDLLQCPTGVGTTSYDTFDPTCSKMFFKAVVPATARAARLNPKPLKDTKAITDKMIGRIMAAFNFNRSRSGSRTLLIFLLLEPETIEKLTIN